MTTRWPAPVGSGTQPLVLAHRGGAAPSGGRDTPLPWENTVEAFAAARRLGADGVEMDVRCTADGTLVVRHDALLPDGGPIHARRRRELPTWLPTLDDALDACGDVLVDVEVQDAPAGARFDTRGIAERVVETLRRRRQPAANPRWLVTSFWPQALAAAGSAVRVDGELHLGLLVHPAADPGGAVPAALQLGCRVVLFAWPHVDRRLVDTAHSVGLAVVPWTVNGEAAFDAVADAGVDGLVTDEIVASQQRRRARRPPA